MILEDEELVRIPLVLNENLSVTIVLTLEVSTNDNHIPCFAQVLNRKLETRQSELVLHIDNSRMIWLSIYGGVMGKEEIRATCFNQSITFIISYHVFLKTFSYENIYYIYASLRDSWGLFEYIMRSLV